MFLSYQRPSSVKWRILFCEILFFSPNQARAERTKRTLMILECMRCTYSHPTISSINISWSLEKKCLQSFVLCAHLLCMWSLVSVTTQNPKKQQQQCGFWDRTVPISVSPRHLAVWGAIKPWTSLNQQLIWLCLGYSWNWWWFIQLSMFTWTNDNSDHCTDWLQTNIIWA